VSSLSGAGNAPEPTGQAGSGRRPNGQPYLVRHRQAAAYHSQRPQTKPPRARGACFAGAWRGGPLTEAVAAVMPSVSVRVAQRAPSVGCPAERCCASSAGCVSPVGTGAASCSVDPGGRPSCGAGGSGVRTPLRGDRSSPPAVGRVEHPALGVAEIQRRGIRALPDQHRWGEQGRVGQNQRLALPVEPQIRVNPRLVEGLRITHASSDR